MPASAAIVPNAANAANLLEITKVNNLATCGFASCLAITVETPVILLVKVYEALKKYY
ncbi:hypothetical protein [Acinetobacter baumannii]|uniref:hypothetical protein n=1 Tax=Acinetobacter baumannii TaxID=470 RepID=UPI0002E35C83|nr:hypothetical protein [Acinetobacter baumannii]